MPKPNACPVCGQTDKLQYYAPLKRWGCMHVHPSDGPLAPLFAPEHIQELRADWALWEQVVPQRGSKREEGPGRVVLP